ncbi:LysR family transcriptional regulator [Planctobacterium marinum]
MGDVELKQIQVFIAVVQSGGLTAAQARLGMGCPAISKHLSDLETRTRLILCSRGRAGFQLTEVGERFYRASLNLQDNWQAFKRDVSALSVPRVRKLRVASVDATLSDIANPLPSVLSRLKSEFADVQISIRLMPPEKIADGLLKQQLDLGLSFRSENRLPLHSEVMYRERLCLVGKSEFLEAETETIIWLELAQQKGLISFKSSHQLHGPSTIAEKLKRIPEQICCESVEEILWQVLVSNRIGLVPVHVLNQYSLASLDLVVQELDDVRSDIYAVYRKDKTQSDIVRRVQQLLRETQACA